MGVDPHKGTPTAVAIGPAEVPLGELTVRASSDQASKLLEWAATWPERTWAVEGAGGLGHVLAQQLLAASERRRPGITRSRPRSRRPGHAAWVAPSPGRGSLPEVPREPPNPAGDADRRIGIPIQSSGHLL